MTQQEVQEGVYEHAYNYAREVLSQGIPGSTSGEEAYYTENVRHVERLEEAYARGYFAGIDSLTIPEP